MPLARLIDQPRMGLWALIAAQLAFWTLAPALSYLTPPLDVVEMYAWGREWVVATFKHPNGPGVILEASRWLTGGAVGWPAFLIAQICVGVTFWAVFSLGRDVLDDKRALAGVLALTGVYFFSWVTPEFNHNVLQMPLWALTILALWRATSTGALIWWALLGLFGGLGLWAKYSHALVLLPAAVWLLWDNDARRRLATLGPWLALGVFLLTAAPQALWLFQNDFLPFEYAARRGEGGGPLPTLEFLLTQVLNHLPMALLLLFAGFFFTRAPAPPAPIDKRAWRFLLLMAFGPLALAALAGLFGMGLRASWGAPMFSLSGLAAIAWLSDRFSIDRLKRLMTGAGVLIVVVSGLYFAHVRYGALFTDDPLRGNWPRAQISRALDVAWRDETGGAPLRIVAGDIWTAGLVNMDATQPPSVLINGDFTISPWVSTARARREGVLIVWRADQTPPPGLMALRTDSAERRLSVRYPHFPDAPPIELHYAIEPPR
ncbi:MAG: glycosyltransferase family 39 protein [Hyphomonadaceae bacterium]